MARGGDVRYFDYRDPLYGFITLDSLEQQLVDTLPFQRLRRVSQLGTTNLVYPTANHTRLEHSLGTLQASTELFDSLLNKRSSAVALSWKPRESRTSRRLLRLAALLHDLGHAPFSHAGEDLFPAGGSYEDYTYRLITETEVGDRINRELGRGAKIRVAEIAVGKAKRKVDSFLSELLTGALGSDRIDYLIRDSYHLGVAYGQFDRHRLFNTLFVRHNEEKDGPELALEEGGLHSVEGFLLARYFMFLDVYFHKTRRILDLHLSECLKDWLTTYPTDLHAFLNLDDAHVLEHVKSSDIADERVLRRGFYRLCFETIDHPGKEQIVAFSWLKEKVGERFGLESIRVDEAEKAPYSYSPPPVYVRMEQGYEPLHVRSELVKSLEKIRKKRIYAMPQIRQDVVAFCKENWGRMLKEVPGE